jgi:hypothetical protein
MMSKDGEVRGNGIRRGLPNQPEYPLPQFLPANHPRALLLAWAERIKTVIQYLLYLYTIGVGFSRKAPHPYLFNFVLI